MGNAVFHDTDYPDMLGMRGTQNLNDTGWKVRSHPSFEPTSDIAR